MKREKRELEAIRNKEIPTLKESLRVQDEMTQKSTKVHLNILSEIKDLKSVAELVEQDFVVVRA